MKNFRDNPMTSLGGSPVTMIKDFAKLEEVDYVRNEQIALEMPTTSMSYSFSRKKGPNYPSVPPVQSPRSNSISKYTNR